MSNDTKSKKQSQDYFDIEEYLEERLAELEAYGDYHYEEELEDRHNEPPIDSYTKEYFFEELFNEYTTPSKAAPATSPILNKDKNLSRYNKLMKQAKVLNVNNLINRVSLLCRRLGAREATDGEWRL